MEGGPAVFEVAREARGVRGKVLLARIVWATHLLIVAVLCVGWLTPWTPLLWAVAVLAPVVQLGWWLNRDRCILTELEEHLRGPRPRPALPGDGDRAPNFIVDLLAAVLRRPVPHEVINRLIYAVTWLGFSVAVLRLTSA